MVAWIVSRGKCCSWLDAPKAQTDGYGQATPQLGAVLMFALRLNQHGNRRSSLSVSSRSDVLLVVQVLG